MGMGIDKARHDDTVSRINDFRTPGVNIFIAGYFNVGDPLSFHQDSGRIQGGLSVNHRDENPTFNNEIRVSLRWIMGMNRP